MSWIESNSVFYDFGQGLNKAYSNSLGFFTRFAVVNMLYTIEVIMNAVDKEKPAGIMAAYSEVFTDSPYVIDGDRVSGKIANIICGMNGLGFTGLPVKEHMTGGLEGLAGLLKYIIKLADFKLRDIPKEKNEKGNGCIIFTSGYYGMSALIQELKKTFPRRKFVELKGPMAATSEIPAPLLKVLAGDMSGGVIRQKGFFRQFADRVTAEGDIFSYRGVNFGGQLSGKLKKAIFNYSLSDLTWLLNLRSYLQNVMPEAVIGSGNRLDEMAVAEYGRALGIKTILVSHGSLVEPKNRYEKLEWGDQGRTLWRLPVDHILLQTPLAEGYLTAFPTESGIVRTGPLIWGGQRSVAGRDDVTRRLFGKCLGKEVKVVVHAGTPKPKYGLRLYVYETMDEYVQSIREVMDAVRGMKDTFLIVRVRPNKDLPLETLKKSLVISDNIVISHEGPFYDVLGAADLLISFSSTTIEEALQNKKPVLLYGCNGRYRHLKAFSIDDKTSDIPEKAVYHVAAPDVLSKAVRAITSLDISAGGFDHIFDEYIYPGSDRVGLNDLLSRISDSAVNKNMNAEELKV
jgi:hypothetical protein